MEIKNKDGQQRFKRLSRYNRDVHKLTVANSNEGSVENMYQSNCEACFGLCCVALPYAKSADFATNKNGGQPCNNLQKDYRCQIHSDLRDKGFKGCTVYECFGAGQKVSQHIYSGNDWRSNSIIADEMFAVFPIVQQLHEMLYYLQEALHREEAKSIHNDLQNMIGSIEALTNQAPADLLQLYIPAHRTLVSELLQEVSNLVRTNNKLKSNGKPITYERKDLIGANLQGANLIGANIRGALLIGANLSGTDLRKADFIGADMRDTNLHGADLRDSLFLTQAQVNAANGDINTKLSAHLQVPRHWL